MLYLASQSPTRAALMAQLGVPYAIVHQAADESQCATDVPLTELVVSIARLKMDNLDHAHMPDNGSWYVITADTLCQAPGGNFLGKPANIAQAKDMLEQQSGHWVTVSTGVCTRHYRVQDGVLHTRTAYTSVVSKVLMHVDEKDRDEYLGRTHAMQAAGAMVIDGYGAAFVEAIHGSYSNILGLPLYETKKLLRQMGYVI
jgi:septum formation protein